MNGMSERVCAHLSCELFGCTMITQARPRPKVHDDNDDGADEGRNPVCSLSPQVQLNCLRTTRPVGVSA